MSIIQPAKLLVLCAAVAERATDGEPLVSRLISSNVSTHQADNLLKRCVHQSMFAFWNDKGGVFMILEAARCVTFLRM